MNNTVVNNVVNTSEKTLRDEIAIAAMYGMLVRSDSLESIAILAYRMADIMLQHRELISEK